MDLLTAVQTAYTAGIVLSTDGHRLTIAGPEPDVPLRAALIAHRPAIVALLVAERIGEPDGYARYEGTGPGPRRYLTPPGCHARGACRRLGWCDGALAGCCCLTLATRDGRAPPGPLSARLTVRDLSHNCTKESRDDDGSSLPLLWHRVHARPRRLRARHLAHLPAMPHQATKGGYPCLNSTMS